MSDVVLHTNLTDAEAWAFAQFLKRLSWVDWKQNAVDEHEAYVMRDASEKVRQAMAQAGYAPR